MSQLRSVLSPRQIALLSLGLGMILVGALGLTGVLG